MTANHGRYIRAMRNVSTWQINKLSLLPTHGHSIKQSSSLSHSPLKAPKLHHVTGVLLLRRDGYLLPLDAEEVDGGVVACTGPSIRASSAICVLQAHVVIAGHLQYRALLGLAQVGNHHRFLKQNISRLQAVVLFFGRGLGSGWQSPQIPETEHSQPSCWGAFFFFFCLAQAGSHYRLLKWNIPRLHTGNHHRFLKQNISRHHVGSHHRLILKLNIPRFYVVVQSLAWLRLPITTDSWNGTLFPDFMLSCISWLSQSWQWSPQTPEVEYSCDVTCLLAWPWSVSDQCTFILKRYTTVIFLMQWRQPGLDLKLGNISVFADVIE